MVSHPAQYFEVRDHACPTDEAGFVALVIKVCKFPPTLQRGFLADVVDALTAGKQRVNVAPDRGFVPTEQADKPFVPFVLGTVVHAVRVGEMMGCVAADDVDMGTRHENTLIGGLLIGNSDVTVFCQNNRVRKKKILVFRRQIEI